MNHIIPPKMPKGLASVDWLLRYAKEKENVNEISLGVRVVIRPFDNFEKGDIVSLHKITNKTYCFGNREVIKSIVAENTRPIDEAKLPTDIESKVFQPEKYIKKEIKYKKESDAALRRRIEEKRIDDSLDELVKKGSVNRDYLGALSRARRSVHNDGIAPTIDEYGNPHYTVEQALAAACHTREDVYAIVLIQESVLRRLQELKLIGWGCVILLFYIAEHVS